MYIHVVCFASTASPSPDVVCPGRPITASLCRTPSCSVLQGGRAQVVLCARSQHKHPTPNLFRIFVILSVCHFPGGGGGGTWQHEKAGRPGQSALGWSNWASCTQKRGETWSGRPGREGEWAATTIKRPPQQPIQPPVRQLLGPANAETTPHGTPAAAAVRKH